MDVLESLCSRHKKMAVIGMGYVGMPLALAFSKYMDVIGFDINETRINEYRQGIDNTKEIGCIKLKETDCFFTSDPIYLKEACCFIIAVPTPINNDDMPDLQALKEASKMIGRTLHKGDYVIYESTVFPGATEEICLPILEKQSGLKCPQDFKIGYSPERINPADTVHTLESIVKIVSGIDDVAKDTIASLYEMVVDAGVHKAPSIKVAEAAKIAENSQRDINIAFLNELSKSFDAMGIDTHSVLEAMGTKWNALSFCPGLVGGHCISVDPYYFIYKSNQLGQHSIMHMIARGINESMPEYVVNKMMHLTIDQGLLVKGCRVAMLGISFKENCPDIRNSKAITMIQKLEQVGMNVDVYDPHVNGKEIQDRLGITLSTDYSTLTSYTAIIIAVGHETFKNLRLPFDTKVKIVIDVKGAHKEIIENNKNIEYWRL